MKDILIEELQELKNRLDKEEARNQACLHRYKNLRTLLQSSRDYLDDALKELDVILDKLEN